MASTTAISNAVPFVKRIDGTKDEITFSANNITFGSASSAVSNLVTVIEDLKAQIASLSASISAVAQGLSIANSTTAASLAAFNTALSENLLTADTIQDALGYRPANAANIFSSFKAATGSASGKSGLVPAPCIAQTDNYFLSANGDWQHLNLDSYLTKDDADALYLSIRGKAASATQADEATLALNVPYTKRGNIWIKSNNDNDSASQG